jgi:pimeloyl-ACP methyl ester carboxylesterase
MTTLAPHLLAFEGLALWELGISIAAFPLLRSVAEGDGHAVLIFPGYGNSDLNTFPLRLYLCECGYEVHGWDQQVNCGPSEAALMQSAAKVRALRRSSGRKVSLVGWSLGGIYAREIAKVMADDVRCVITLGTPLRLSPQLCVPPPMPTSALYSRSDGWVSWQSSIQRRSPLAENIEIPASHQGMGLNPAAWYAIADRLAQPEDRWKPFHREGWRSWFFPVPEWGG